MQAPTHKSSVHTNLIWLNFILVFNQNPTQEHFCTQERFTFMMTASIIVGENWAVHSVSPIKLMITLAVVKTCIFVNKI